MKLQSINEWTETVNEASMRELAQAMINGDTKTEAKIRSHYRKSMWTKSDIEKALAPEMASLTAKKVKDLEQVELKKLQKVKPSKLTYDEARRLYELEQIYGVKPRKWNEREYQKWIKDVASGGGANHSYDMARNAEFESGLIDYINKKIKKDYGNETAMERIQWDIEAHA